MRVRESVHVKQKARDAKHRQVEKARACERETDMGVWGRWAW